MSDPELTIAIATRNEAATLPALLGAIRPILDGLGHAYEILVVDGHSSDGTREAASSRGCRVVLQPRTGLGDAVRHAFREARGRFIVTMDADLSHPPELLRDLVTRRHEADLLLASRYVPGGRTDDIPTRRRLSLILNRAFAVVLGLPYRDISTGYRIYRGEFLRETPLEADQYDIQEEVVFRIHRRGGRILEIPMHFQARQGGASKARIVRQGLFFASTLLRLWRERIR